MRIRVSTGDDIPVLVELLHAFMTETFNHSWNGSAEALLRDGFGAEIEIVVAGEPAVAFAAWQRTYDLHHCMAGATILDMFVRSDHRCCGLGVSLVAFIADRAREQGAQFLRASTAPSRAPMYERLAAQWPEVTLNIGGRAFRALADQSGKPPRVIAASFPPKTWCYEP